MNHLIFTALIRNDSLPQLRIEYFLKAISACSCGTSDEPWNKAACWLAQLSVVVWVVPQFIFKIFSAYSPIGWDFSFRCLISWSFSSIAWWRSACNSFSFWTNSSSNLQKKMTLVDKIRKLEQLQSDLLDLGSSSYKEHRHTWDFNEMHVLIQYPVALRGGLRFCIF